MTKNGMQKYINLYYFQLFVIVFYFAMQIKNI